MKMSPGKFNSFLFFKLPSAWICGVRVQQIDSQRCETSVKHRWINQNPFNSMYFAVQAMAAELSTGAMVIGNIEESGRKISMLVAQNKAVFSKKATGKISFVCDNGQLVSEAISKTIETREGQTFWMKSVGVNEDGVEVSVFDFEWTVKLKSK